TRRDQSRSRHNRAGNPPTKRLETVQTNRTTSNCRYFCHEYDQKAFDPDYPTKPLEFFEPLLRRILNRGEGHMELNETSDG
ncbi:hypothetical protein SAMN05444279_1171, partial [Ruegeria intermedia]